MQQEKLQKAKEDSNSKGNQVTADNDNKVTPSTFVIVDSASKTSSK